MVREILLLGTPSLYEVSQPVSREELPSLEPVIRDMWDTIDAYRRTYGAGRAIAAPQIGVNKRVIAMKLPGEKPQAFLNPSLRFPDGEQMTVLDDCMSFPGLLVRLKRYCRCELSYRDLDWQEQTLSLSGDLSELLQHEYDHLDGILATMRAQSPKDFYYRKTGGSQP